MSRLTVGSIEGLVENSNVISVPTGHSLNVVDGIQAGGENITHYTGRRNLLYNGAMQVAQRGTSETGITSSGYYTADRWQGDFYFMGTWTQSIENDAPTGSGFRKSLKVLCTTADATPAAADDVQIRQNLEGQDLQQVKKGTSAAEQLTVSFWVKSNVTGTYIAELRDLDNNRQVSASYSVAASGTWEKKTITFPADTTGAFDNDNAGSLRVAWWLGAGSDYATGTLNTSWGTLNGVDRAVGQTNLAAATGNYWQITGVQLELGDKATPFEYRSFGEELALCRRYFQILTCNDAYTPVGIGNFNSATQIIVKHRLSPSMRTSATISYSNISHFDIEPFDQAPSSLAGLTTGQSEDYAVIEAISPTSRTQGFASTIVADVNGAFMSFSAEL